MTLTYSLLLVGALVGLPFYVYILVAWATLGHRAGLRMANRATRSRLQSIFPGGDLNDE